MSAQAQLNRIWYDGGGRLRGVATAIVGVRPDQRRQTARI